MYICNYKLQPMKQSPKEKAEELVNKFENHVRYDNCTEEPLKHLQIECAKIEVDDIIDEVIHLQEESEGVYGAIELFTRHTYWEQVKQELEKM